MNLQSYLLKKMLNVIESKLKITKNYFQTLNKTVFVTIFSLMVTTITTAQPLQTVPYVDLKKYHVNHCNNFAIKKISSTAFILLFKNIMGTGG